MKFESCCKAFKTRYFWLLFVLLSVLFCLIGRLLYLHIIDKDFLLSQGESRSIRVVDVPAYRGMIKDRNGQPLAISTPVYSVWVNPQQLDVQHHKLATLAKLVNSDIQSIQAKVNKYKAKEFVYLQRHISPALAEKIKNLSVHGVHLASEYRRYYPTGEVSAQVLGFTNIDDHGQEGLELAFDSWLHGTIGKKRILKDGLGRHVKYLDSLADNHAGKDLVLSLDQRLQYMAYRALQQAVVQHRAASGSAVVLDIQTGEVLAMVNNPSFNPNKRMRSNQSDTYRNRSVTDYFEPGSVIKALSLASVLENTNQITAKTLVDTRPGYMRLQGGVVRDDYNNGLISVVNIFRRSSNMGIAKLTLDLPQRALWDTYDRFGLGMLTGSGFPGESMGVLSAPRSNQSFVLATMSFGYALAVTPLQLARAYAILGAGGIRRPVTFIKTSDFVPGIRVLDLEVAQKLVRILHENVEHKRSNARVTGYHVAGKTGTARQVGRDGYERGRHRAVFAGLAPAINPRFSIVVVIHDPKGGKYYGNQVAAPVFSRIASCALRIFDVAPDLLDTQGVYLAKNGG